MEHRDLVESDVIRCGMLRFGTNPGFVGLKSTGQGTQVMAHEYMDASTMANMVCMVQHASCWVF